MSTLTTFHADIKNILEQARSKARSAVNAVRIRCFSTQRVEKLEEVTE
jgi:hypothetical protein